MNVGNWSCKCSANLRIVSQKNGTEDLTKNIDRVFNNKENSWGFKNFITFTDLMTNSDEELYDSEEAKVTLAIDLTVKEERGIKRKLTMNKPIQSLINHSVELTI
ncbi:hypothetical protein niasHT_028487 [Heterodera trifolii]|uniref:MATH domain-containing protein n=1 Tax=Heterodera trifolii TaxID=157864 RepID=A0ABD2KPR6_9BILA